MKSKNNIVLWLALTGSMVCYGQNAIRNQIWKDIQKTLVENFDNTENHQQLIRTKIGDLIEKYGREKTQEILKIHAIQEINQHKQGEKYTSNDSLDKAAQNHANDMSQNHYFNHQSKEWTHVWERVGALGTYNYQYLGENISNGDALYDIILSYLKSKKWGHEEIFDQKYQDIGIGIAPIQEGNPKNPRYYVVFHFGKTF